MKKIKLKPYYHTFEFEGRCITLCITPTPIEDEYAVEILLFVGWAVRNPNDKIDDELGKKIAFGRSLKKRGVLRLTDVSNPLGYNSLYLAVPVYLDVRRFQKELAILSEQRIKEGRTDIKGLNCIKDKDKDKNECKSNP